MTLPVSSLSSSPSDLPDWAPVRECRDPRTVGVLADSCSSTGCEHHWNDGHLDQADGIPYLHREPDGRHTLSDQVLLGQTQRSGLNCSFPIQVCYILQCDTRRHAFPTCVFNCKIAILMFTQLLSTLPHEDTSYIIHSYSRTSIS